MSDVEWVDSLPKLTRNGGTDGWFDVLAPLSERPGVWAIVRRCENARTSASVAGYLRRRSLKKQDGYEFVARCNCVYARYVGCDDLRSVPYAARADGGNGG